MDARKFLGFMLIAVLLILLNGSVASSDRSNEALTSWGCTPGADYDPACDVDHDGDVDVLDIQLTAGHWGDTGTYVGDYWSLVGNANTVPGVHFLGTTDDQPLELKVHGSRALRIEPHDLSPAIAAGWEGNSITAGAQGVTIAGGGTGDTGDGCTGPNRVTDDYGTVGGGMSNRSGSDNGNPSDAAGATVAGGEFNIAGGLLSAVGGGSHNQALGIHATVGGGSGNEASNHYATVVGGRDNVAFGEYSLAAGRRAMALHSGSFVWADGLDAFFTTTAPNQFAVRSNGGAVFTGTHASNAMVTAVNLGGGDGVHATGTTRGVYGEATAVSGNTAGVYGKANSPEGFAGYFEGDVSQSAEADGLVKIGAHIFCGGGFSGADRWFNHLSGTIGFDPSPANPNGTCVINLGADISQRYWVATADGYVRGASCIQGSDGPTWLECARWQVSTGQLEGGWIMLLVY